MRLEAEGQAVRDLMQVAPLARCRKILAELLNAQRIRSPVSLRQE